jgi:hypothetical protein
MLNKFRNTDPKRNIQFNLMIKKTVLILYFLFPILSFAQRSTADTNYVFWSKDRRLQQSDFKIKVAHISSMYSFAQYSLDYKLNGTFAFGLPKDYKKKIRNYFIKNASWLDTTFDVNTSIRYQQTLFDLAEIHVRYFRKSVYDNRKKIAWGKVKIDELNSQAMTAFSNRRVQYDIATNFGAVADKQKEWEILITKELEQLKVFSVD